MSKQTRHAIEWRMGDKGIWREQDSYASESEARRVLSILRNQSRVVRERLGKDRRGKYQPMMKYRIKEKPIFGKSE